MSQQKRIHELIIRLARLDANEAWVSNLNPSQKNVLDYLSRANKFSRGPSQVAAYLGSTRGTISQSLKSLGKKGYVSETRSATDKRTIRFDLTSDGNEITQYPNGIASRFAELSLDDQKYLDELLSEILMNSLEQNKGKPFGVCKTCVHFSPKETGGFCNLLSEELTVQDTTKICYEQVPA